MLATRHSRSLLCAHTTSHLVVLEMERDQHARTTHDVQAKRDGLSLSSSLHQLEMRMSSSLKRRVAWTTAGSSAAGQCASRQRERAQDSHEFMRSYSRIVDLSSPFISAISQLSCHHHRHLLAALTRCDPPLVACRSVLAQARFCACLFLSACTVAPQRLDKKRRSSIHPGTAGGNWLRHILRRPACVRIGLRDGNINGRPPMVRARVVQ